MKDRRHLGQPNAADRLTRRTLLRTGSMTVASGLAANACGFFDAAPDGSGEGDSNAATNGAEAPGLAELTEKGELPAVEERLPQDPLVIEPVERIGRYGGTWNSFIRGSDSGRVGLMIGYEPLVRWSRDWSTVVPNVAASWSVGEFGRECVFQLRDGMKWSDGEPFTADDIVFAYNDVLLNPELNPVTPYIFVAGGEPAQIEKLDEYSIRFTFAAPSAFFPKYLATADGLPLCQRPKHYLQEFHRVHNEDVDALVKQEGFDDWIQLFLAQTDLWESADTPTLHAWLIDRPSGSGSQVVAIRNPYYWKTDPEGSQLPYLDRVVWDVVNTDEVALLKATSGELHAELWESIQTFANKPVLARSRKEGGYHFTTVVESLINYSMIALNLTHKDTALRDVFRNKDVRIGLSLAINRQEIIDTVFQRQGTPWQGAPRPGSTYSFDELGEQYVEYDPDAAEQYLERAGFDQRDPDGFRLRPDGERLSFAIDVAAGDTSPYPYVVDVMELVKGYWTDAGVDVTVNSLERSLFQERLEGNDFDVSVWPGGKALDDAILNPDWYLPFNTLRTYAPLWAQWYNSGGETGEKPTEPSLRQMELYDQIQQTMDEEERRRLFTDILQISADEFFVIGVALPEAGYGIVRDDFHNVPAEMPGAYVYYTPGPSAPEQYFLED